MGVRGKKSGHKTSGKKTARQGKLREAQFFECGRLPSTKHCEGEGRRRRDASLETQRPKNSWPFEGRVDEFFKSFRAGMRFRNTPVPSPQK